MDRDTPTPDKAAQVEETTNGSSARAKRPAAYTVTYSRPDSVSDGECTRALAALRKVLNEQAQADSSSSKSDTPAPKASDAH